MKKLVTFISIIAAVHFLLCCAILAFLKLSGFATLGLSDSVIQRFLYRVFCILAFLDPLSWLHLDARWWSVGLAFALNSIVWSVCLGLFVYEVRSRVQRPVA
jgi:hypothetical protein